MSALQVALAAARADLDKARQAHDMHNLDMAAASALIAIGELLAGMAAHLAEADG